MLQIWKHLHSCIVHRKHYLAHEYKRDICRKGNGGSDKPASNPQAEVTEPAANLTFGQLTFGGEGNLQSSESL